MIFGMAALLALAAEERSGALGAMPRGRTGAGVSAPLGRFLGRVERGLLDRPNHTGARLEGQAEPGAPIRRAAS